jgi:hypothetical protein
MKKFLYTYLPMKMEQTECSETLAHKIQTPGNYPEECIQHLQRLFSSFRVLCVVQKYYAEATEDGLHAPYLVFDLL